MVAVVAIGGHVTSAESTDLFVGPPDAPLQVVGVTHTGGTSPVTVEGDGLATPAPPVADAAGGAVEVPVEVRDPVPGERRAARVLFEGTSTEFEFIVAEPGWTMFMISHFHYDPVWWNTQAAYTSLWTEEPPGRARQTNGFNLVAAHLEMARREPEYKFVLAEVDYLKPYWDTHPEDRADLRRFIGEGRVEIMGGTYNEPNTNLTSPETTIRNFVARHGLSARRGGRRPGHRVAARRVRPRPAVPRHGGRCRADVEFVGARAASPVGPDAPRRRCRAHAVLQRVRVDLPVGPRAADPLHACALLGRLVDGLVGRPSRRPRPRPTTCSRR